MATSHKAVFMAGYDGIDSSLSIINNIDKQDANLDLYTYDLAAMPSFLLRHFVNTIEIPQTFYTRTYSSRLQKISDRINFLKLFMKSKLKTKTGRKYDELHFLGYLNCPSFLIYENLFRSKDSAAFYYKVPDRDFYKENKLNRDWKLWVLEKLFSRKFMYYDYPPQKVAIGLSEKELTSAKTYPWKILAKEYGISAAMLNIKMLEEDRVLVLGTQYGDFLNPVDLETTAQNVTAAILKEFPDHTIYYKAHYRADFDLIIPDMRVVERCVPAEFIIPYFNVICGFDSRVFYSCAPGIRMISLLKLMNYSQGYVTKDLKILKNNIGSDKLELIEFLT